MNEAEVRSLGYTKEELIGKNVKFYGDGPSEGATQEKIIQETLSKGYWRGRVINFNAKGEKVVFDTRTQIVLDKTGRPIALCGIATDITESVRAQEQLKINEYRLREAERIGRVGSWERDMRMNEFYRSDETYRIFGYEPNTKELPKDILNRHLYPDDRKLFWDNFNHAVENQNESSRNEQFRIINLKGELRYCAGRSEFFRDRNGICYKAIGSIHDITEQKRAEQKIREELRDKKILLQEIHHRVKNNLNVVSSLLNLQIDKITTIEQAKNALKNSRKRVYSMAMVHENMYMTESFSHVDMKRYISMMINELLEFFKLTDTVRYQLDVENITFDIDHAIPCGIIINELVTNALKHAFPGREGNVMVKLERLSANNYQLVVRDDGVGMAEDIDITSSKTLGLQLIMILTDQLEGTLEISRNRGTCFSIKFPIYHK